MGYEGEYVQYGQKVKQRLQNNKNLKKSVMCFYCHSELVPILKTMNLFCFF